MAKGRVIVLHWKGPFSIAEACENREGKILYLATGRKKFQRIDQIQYCGITEGSFNSRKNGHHKLSLITKNPRIWIGKIVHPYRVTRSDLEAAESLIIYFGQPDLNNRKRVHPPTSTIVISHWFNKDTKPRQNRSSILSDLDDVLCWDGKDWRSGNLHRWPD